LPYDDGWQSERGFYVEKILTKIYAVNIIGIQRGRLVSILKRYLL
jgi:hypothetical protein